jgi:hypothetical protein
MRACRSLRSPAASGQRTAGWRRRPSIALWNCLRELFELTGPVGGTKEVSSEGWAKNMFIGLIQRVRVAVHKEAMVDILNSTASKWKSNPWPIRRGSLLQEGWLNLEDPQLLKASYINYSGSTRRIQET